MPDVAWVVRVLPADGVPGLFDGRWREDLTTGQLASLAREQGWTLDASGFAVYGSGFAPVSNERGQAAGAADESITALRKEGF